MSLLVCPRWTIPVDGLPLIIEASLTNLVRISQASLNTSHWSIERKAMLGLPVVRHPSQSRLVRRTLRKAGSVAKADVYTPQ